MLRWLCEGAGPRIGASYHGDGGPPLLQLQLCPAETPHGCLTVHASVDVTHEANTQNGVPVPLLETSVRPGAETLEPLTDPGPNLDQADFFYWVL